MKKLKTISALALATLATACAVDVGEGEQGEPRDETEAVAEISSELEVGEIIVVRFDMRGKVFPQAACMNHIGEPFSFLADGCVFNTSFSNCTYNSETKSCTCSGTIQSMSC
jgi:hypothetical protein